MNTELIAEIRASLQALIDNLQKGEDLSTSLDTSRILLRRLREEYRDESAKAHRMLATLVFDALTYTPPERIQESDIRLTDSIMEAFVHEAVDADVLSVSSELISESNLNTFPEATH